MRPSILAVIAVSCATACGNNDSGRHIMDAPAQHNPGIYITSTTGAVTAYPIDANGDTAPFRTIAGPSTQLSLPIGIVVDHAGEIYIANRTGSNVTVYGADATGDAAPIRTLTATNMLSPEGLSRGATDDVYVTTCPSCGQSNGGDTGIYHFPASATASDWQISGAATMLTAPGAEVDPTNGDIVASNSFGGAFVTFTAGQMGNVAPVRAFTPQGVGNAQGWALGATAIAITNPGQGVSFFDRQATGTPSPIGTLDGTTFGLSYPGAIYIDETSTPTLIYVVDFGSNAIHVLEVSGTEPNYTITTMRTISGPSTMLSAPIGLAVVH